MKLKDKLLSKQPFCVYCGGTTRASTVDHLPARVFFKLRERPQGLEFPCCPACNSGSRIDEMVAAMISRSFPAITSEDEKAEIVKMARGISNNHPQILTELLPDLEQEQRARSRMANNPDFGGAMNAGGPLVRDALNRFAAKVEPAIWVVPIAQADSPTSPQRRKIVLKFCIGQLP